MARTDEIKEGMERIKGMQLTFREEKALDGLIKSIKQRKAALESFDGDAEIAIILLALLDLKARYDKHEEDYPPQMKCVGP